MFTKSKDFKSEYCCRVVQIGPILPIEGKDKIGQTLVDGFPVVVRKDQVKEGDRLFYVSNECQIEDKFLRLNNLYDEKERNADPNIKGYFNRYGRVRIVKLGGIPSMGYLFAPEELRRVGYKFDVMPTVGDEFDTINNDLFVKAFVPPTKEQSQSQSGLKRRQKRLKKFDRMIPGEFSFHYDTDQLEKNICRFKPEDVVTLTVKEHGTSSIYAHIKTRKPKWGGLYEKYYMYLPKCLQKTVEEWSYIYSSRTVIKNKDINKKVTDGFYGSDVWALYSDIIQKYDLLDRGMTIYGEIIGYTQAGSAIQKLGVAYDYGCEPGQSKLMIYRIVTHHDNKKYEWNIMDVLGWTLQVIRSHPELDKVLYPIPVLYHGPFKDLYPDIPTDQYWHENVLARLKEDKNFYMEMDEPLCKNKVPREGIVIRKDDDVLAEAFKLKTMKFRFGEAKAVDAGQVDIEMEQAY